MPLVQLRQSFFSLTVGAVISIISFTTLGGNSAPRVLERVLQRNVADEQTLIIMKADKEVKSRTATFNRCSSSPAIHGPVDAVEKRLETLQQ